MLADVAKGGFVFDSVSAHAGSPGIVTALARTTAISVFFSDDAECVLPAMTSNSYQRKCLGANGR